MLASAHSRQSSPPSFLKLTLLSVNFALPRSIYTAKFLSSTQFPFPYISSYLQYYTFTSMMNRWFSGMVHASFRCKDAVLWWVSAAIVEGHGNGFLIRVVKKAAFGAFTCILALGGAVVGIIVGAMKGQTTETGFLRGSGIGAVAGAITAIQLLESVANGEHLSKGALLCSMVNGKVFMEWVGPAVLKAYQSQVSALETTYQEISDIYDTNGARGLSQDFMVKLPEFIFQSTNNIVGQSQVEESCCSICLQDFKDGESLRKLPRCGHFFHLGCLDKWLTRNGSCPMCRNSICNENL